MGELRLGPDLKEPTVKDIYETTGNWSMYNGEITQMFRLLLNTPVKIKEWWWEG